MLLRAWKVRQLLDVGVVDLEPKLHRWETGLSDVVHRRDESQQVNEGLRKGGRGTEAAL